MSQNGNIHQINKTDSTEEVKSTKPKSRFSRTVDWSDFDPSKVLGTLKQDKNNYCQYEAIPFEFGKTKKGKPIYVDIQYPECESRVGVEYSEKHGGHSIKVFLSHEQHGEFIKKMDAFEDRIDDILVEEKTKSNVKQIKKFKKGEARPYMQEGILYYGEDENGDPDKTKNPSQYLKLYEYDNMKTEFYDLTDTQRDMKTLMNKKVTLIPVVRFQRIYIGQVITLQWRILSATIVRVRDVEEVKTLEQKTAEKYKNEHPEALAEIEAYFNNLGISPENPSENNTEGNTVEKKEEPNNAELIAKSMGLGNQGNEQEGNKEENNNEENNNSGITDPSSGGTDEANGSISFETLAENQQGKKEPTVADLSDFLSLQSQG